MTKEPEEGLPEKGRQEEFKDGRVCSRGGSMEKETGSNSEEASEQSAG